jgi:outer membrane protein OmpA-like peptidoglycan-associated protein
MSARVFVMLTASAVLLAGCVQQPAADRSFAVGPGGGVPAGIPCGHVDQDRRSSVLGCEAFVAAAGSDMPRELLIDLNTRFRQEVQVIVNFDFGRDNLRPDARAILDRQAEWILRYPGLRFSVFGHTDLVGSLDYNFDLAKRRTDRVVAYLLSRGVAQAQLESVVSFGKTQPLIDTPRREEQNRRTVTEVSGLLRVAGRTTVPLSCDWIDGAYLPTYNQCIARGPGATRILPPPPPPPSGPNPVPRPVVAEYSGPSVDGRASITPNADGSETRAASGTTGDPAAPTTSTRASSTTAANGGNGPRSANASGPGSSVSASATPNLDPAGRPFHH